MTELGDADLVAAAAFWQRAIDAGVVPTGTAMPTAIEPFGDSVEMADELIELIVDGPKRATAAALADFELDGLPLPVVDGLAIATDGSGMPRALLRTTDVRVGPLSTVDDSFAWDEGEGDRSRAYWLDVHEDFFRRFLSTIGLTFDDDMMTVFERFEVLYTD
jgi:uncharacterized protein YhfF